MHMADALISPAVGGVMWGATAVTAAYSGRKVRTTLDESKIPLMGVAGAFVFAAQMLNFTIPGTGSSGHLVGGLILAILLGPHAAFLVIASILTVQALFFGDGGLLALGANIINMGFMSVYIAYPLIYRRIVGNALTPARWKVILGSVLASVIGLQLGALAVVLETWASGISELPFTTFLWLMLPIHLAIGAVEGLVTAVVVLFVLQAQPELLASNAAGKPLGKVRLRPVLIGLAVAAVIAGGVGSWFASTHADGLEWSIAKVTGTEEGLRNTDRAHEAAADLQQKTAILPDYTFKEDATAGGEVAAADEAPAWPAVDAGTSVAGVVGGLMVLAVVVAVGFALRRRSAMHPGAGAQAEGPGAGRSS
jgi:cobalt/nickel transport system permease protein